MHALAKHPNRLAVAVLLDMWRNGANVGYTGDHKKDVSPHVNSQFFPAQPHVIMIYVHGLNVLHHVDDFLVLCPPGVDAHHAMALFDTSASHWACPLGQEEGRPGNQDGVLRR